MIIHIISNSTDVPDIIKLFPTLVLVKAKSYSNLKSLYSLTNVSYVLENQLHFDKFCELQLWCPDRSLAAMFKHSYSMHTIHVI